ncbi:hypothetical protein BJX99DRAFT_68194 [Aspergillus californicus]
MGPPNACSKPQVSADYTFIHIMKNPKFVSPTMAPSNTTAQKLKQVHFDFSISNGPQEEASTPLPVAKVSLFTPRKRSPLANEIYQKDESSSTSSWDRALEITPASAKAILAEGAEDTQPTRIKMSEDTDISDKVLHQGRGNTLQGISSKKAQQRLLPTRKPPPKPAAGKTFHNVEQSWTSQISEQVSEDLHKGVAIPSGGLSSTSTAEKENRYKSLQETPADELARLRKEILVNAHRGRAKDLPTASPELLARCRDGEGTKLDSAVYNDLAKGRVVSQNGIEDSSYIGFTLSTEAAEDKNHEVSRAELECLKQLCRETYMKSSTAYPILLDEVAEGKYERLELSPTPTTKKHEDMMAKIRKSQPGKGQNSTSFNTEPQMVKVLENSWSDPSFPDWQYSPRCIPDAKHYRLQLQSWLESTIERKCFVDIFHEAFFNGTAHADGETSMFMLNMRNHETHLDHSDKKTTEHWHETVAGYMHNTVSQKRKAEASEEHRKQTDLQRRIEAQSRRSLYSPSSPQASIYLRPVNIDKDLPELKEIYNWYSRYSFCSPDAEVFDIGEIHQRIEGSCNANLPFIVAIDRRSTSKKHAEKILGYACAREFDGNHLASQFTAELELYVRDGYMNKGIGKCLLDKLLEVCDPTYQPHSSYLFEADEDRSKYFSGGVRKLAKLVFTLGYVDHTEQSSYKRVKKWLEEYAEFEEQGVLRGLRVKDKKLINVAYLVRDANGAGANGSKKWEP